MRKITAQHISQSLLPYSMVRKGELNIHFTGLLLLVQRAQADPVAVVNARPCSIPQASQEEALAGTEGRHIHIAALCPHNLCHPPSTSAGCGLGVPGRREPSDTHTHLLVPSAPGQNLPTDYSSAKKKSLRFPMLSG